MQSRVTRHTLQILFLTSAMVGVSWAQRDTRSGSSDLGKIENPGPIVERSENDYALLPGDVPQNRLLFPALKHFVADEEHFWTAPTHLRIRDLRWVLPLTGGAGALIASDSWISKQIPSSQLPRSTTISKYGVYALAGSAGGAFLWGSVAKDDHMRETGFLAGEAAANAGAVAYIFKALARRPRPFQDGGNGSFFSGGSSFPSEHSAFAWSIASVVAHEYPGSFTKAIAYGLASAVTLTRITSGQHFSSDAVIGSLMGWYFGREVYRAHHDAELGGAAWGNFLENDNHETGTPNPDNMGSPAVPVDSWVYPLFERMAALGYIQSAYLGMRPWTRMECARLLEEAEDRIRYRGLEEPEVQRIYLVLSREFSDETARLNGTANLGATLDSIYMRGTEVSGTPLRDGYHFGQTIVNDHGRPYWTGFNSITGITAHAVAGPLSFDVQGEYQHAPAVPSDLPQVLAATAAADFTSPLPNGRREINRLRLLSGAVSLRVRNIQISFGKQSQWMGPGEAGPLLLSDNATPFTMLKISSASPFEVPGISKLLGSIRTEFFVGQLSGLHWEYCVVPSCLANVNAQGLIGPSIAPQPFIHGDKISFKPTENLEFGFGVTAMFGGPGLPVTWGNFLRTYYVHSPNAASNPGKRSSAFDFSYRVPGLRKWLTIYSDSLVVDEFSPIGSTRPTLNPGIYLPQIAKLHKLEFRAEFLQTAHSSEFVPGFVYSDFRRFRSGYTNDGNLLASWIGRAGRGGQGWATYWISPRTKIQLGYRQQMAYKDFIKGGRLTDYSVRGEYMLGSEVGLSGLLQYEQWWFPVLSTSTQSDMTASFQVTFYPHWQVRK